MLLPLEIDSLIHESRLSSKCYHFMMMQLSAGTVWKMFCILVFSYALRRVVRIGCQNFFIDRNHEFQVCLHLFLIQNGHLCLFQC